MSTYILETKDLVKKYKTPFGMLHAVDGVSLQLEEGKTLGVVGESGCGKTTLGKLVVKLTKATSGRILYKGEDITRYSRGQMKKIRTEIQMIFQDPYSSINPRMTVFDLLAEPVRINGLASGKADIEKLVHETMELVGLSSRVERAYPHELDGGRRQRIGVGRALIMKPRLIVCDEPVSALDVSIQAGILNLLMDLKDELNLTYLFITHDMSVVKHISDEIMVLHLGQCVEQAPTDTIFRYPEHPYTQALLSSIPVPSLDTRLSPEIVLHGEIASPIEPLENLCRFRSRCQIGLFCDGHFPHRLAEIGHDHFCSCEKRIARLLNPPSRKRPKTLRLSNVRLPDGKTAAMVIKDRRVLCIDDGDARFSGDFLQIDGRGLYALYGELDENNRILPQTIRREIAAGDPANILLVEDAPGRGGETVDPVLAVKDGRALNERTMTAVRLSVKIEN